MSLEKITQSENHTIRIRFDVDRLSWIAEHSNGDLVHDVALGYGSGRHINYVIGELKKIYPKSDIKGIMA